MTVSRTRLLFASCFILILSIIPIPQPFDMFRPLWVLTLVLYLQCSVAKGCNVVFVFLIGLCLDALGAGLMGQHALALLLSAWVASSNAQRFRLFTMGHQMLGLVFFCLVYQVTLFGTGLLLGYQAPLSFMLLPIFATVILWPWMQLLADRIFLTRSLKANFSS